MRLARLLLVLLPLLMWRLREHVLVLWFLGATWLATYVATKTLRHVDHARSRLVKYNHGAACRSPMRRTQR